MTSIRAVLAATKKADETFNLIVPGDKIALGISGGKDSLCLLLAMHHYALFSKKDFQIVPITLDLGFPGFDPEPIKEYVASLGLTLHLVDEKEVYPILLSHQKPGHHVPCSICSRMKKAAINLAAKELGCNKVAFAHHADDAMETLLMNMVHGGAVATFEPKMRLDRAGIDFIRPFIFVHEEQLVSMAEEEGLPVMGKTCPADGYTERQWAKDLLSSLYQERPESKKNFQTMLYDPEAFRLYFHHIEYPNPKNGHLSLRPLLEVEETISYARFAEKNHLPPLLPEQKHFLLLKDGEAYGKISYVYLDSHRLGVMDFSYVGLSNEEATALYEQFMNHLWAKINPLTFVYNGEDEAIPLSLGYRKDIPGFLSLPTKMCQR